MGARYYDRKHLPAFSDIREGQPQLGEAFFSYYGQVFRAGALSSKEKALSALAVAHTIQCPYCIEAYTSGSLEKGADPTELTAAVHVAALVRAQSTLSFGRQSEDLAARLSLLPSEPHPSYFDESHTEARTSSPLEVAFAAWKEGSQDALEPRTRAAIAVACAHALPCPYMIRISTGWGLEQDLNLEALTEAVHVAAAIRSGASLIHGLQMLEHLEEAKR